MIQPRVSHPRSRSRSLAAPLALGLTGIVAAGLLASAPAAMPALAAPEAPSAYTEPTYSSPISLSADKQWLWSVNPADDSVSVISTATDSVVAKIAVGNEPESVALDPNNQFAYVANAADNTVSIIRITSLAPWSASIVRTYITGAEPWNIVVSPDGKRVFVANSVQDTITVLDATAVWPAIPTIIGNYDLNSSPCNAANPDRHFQPRGLAVTLDNTKLYVTRFLSFVKPGGQQTTDTGKEGLVCRLDISTSAYGGPGITGATPITLAAQPTGFNNPNGSPTSAYANQLQSIVIRGDNAYMPNIAAAPAGPLRFNVSTQAFVNAISGVNSPTQADAGAINMHLGARVPEAGKKRLFFANPWAIAFTNQSGAGNAYAVSSGSDLLVKLNVDAAGALSFTGGVSTTRYIDLNDPDTSGTAGANAGKNPLGIVINGSKAYVMNKLSRNVSVVDLTTDAVSGVIQLTPLPASGSKAEELHVGAEMFFSSRGHFERPPGTTVSTDERLSSEGWQNCASCHFNGWTDGEIWSFASGPRKSVPLNGSFNPHNPNDQRIFNYSAFFDQVEDFEINIRNISGPGPLPAPVNGTTNNANQGLIISDTGDINTAPAVVNQFLKSNADRPQVTVRLPGSTTSWPAMTALREWVKLAIRTPNGVLTQGELSTPSPGITPNPDYTGALNDADVAAGKLLFVQAGCLQCHASGKWTNSTKDFASPPGAGEIATETVPTPTFGTPVGAQFLNRFLVNINSFNLNVAGQGNSIPGQAEIGAVEKNEAGLDALGRDYNADGKGIGFNTPSLLGIHHVPPYYHNGACETLACVLANPVHRVKGLPAGSPDPLTTSAAQAKVVAFLKTLDANTSVPTTPRMPFVAKQ
jgi:YVTN family beta-propeller protein